MRERRPIAGGEGERIARRNGVMVEDPLAGADLPKGAAVIQDRRKEQDECEGQTQGDREGGIWASRDNELCRPWADRVVVPRQGDPRHCHGRLWARHWTTRRGARSRHSTVGEECAGVRMGTGIGLESSHNAFNSAHPRLESACPVADG